MIKFGGTKEVIESYHYLRIDTRLIYDRKPRQPHIIVGAVKNEGLWALVDKDGNVRGQAGTLIHSAYNPRSFDDE